MKRNQFFPSLATALAGISLLAACSSEEPMNPGQQSEQDKAITLVSDVAMSRSANVDLQRTQIAAGVKVGAFVTSSNAIVADNAELTADGNGGLSGEVGNYPSTGTVSVYAYAPYNSAWHVNEANSFSIATDQSFDHGYLASDLLRGVPSGENSFSPQDAAIPLVFEHMLSKVNVKINKGTTDVDLTGARIRLVGIKTVTTLNPQTGELGEAQGTPSEIKTVTIDAENTNFAGSAIIVPQTIAAGQFVKIQTADNQDIIASLGSEVNFKSKKSYTYTVNLAGGGSEITATISVNTSISDWVDDEELSGDGENAVSYGVGDYVMKDGTLMKAAAAKRLSGDDRNNVAGVIFTTNVSEEDAAAGYAGYALSVGGRMSNLAWRSITEGEADSHPAPLLRKEGVQGARVAFDTKDGLSITKKAQTQDDGGTYPAFDFTNYSYTNNLSEATNLSGWFIPSIGQMVTIFNNLGGAGINATDVEFSNYGEYIWKDADIVQIVKNINSYKIADTDPVVGYGSVQYMSSTEYDNTRVWGFSVNQNGGSEEFKLISRAGKTGTRSYLPCVAYKLPN